MTTVSKQANQYIDAPAPFSNTQQPIWSNTDTLDGGKVWKKKCAGNPVTFENIYNSNHTTDVFAVESARTKAADAAWSTLSKSA